MSIADNPLISIVVPVYNVERYIDECLNSIKNQTYQNLEIIVVEDCSTDSSIQTLQSHLEDDRVRLIQHATNSGLSAARNTGIDAATGEYLMFVDSDDVVDGRLVEVCVGCAQRYSTDVLTYGCIPFVDGEPITDIAIDIEKLVSSCKKMCDEYFELSHFAWLKFVKMRFLKSAGIRFPVGLYYEDWPFHWGLGLAADTIFSVESGLYHYRQRGTSITGSTGEKLLDLFKVHALVADMIGNATAKSIRRALGNKLYDSYWSILTRIQDRSLAHAYVQAKDGANQLHKNAINPMYTPRRRIIALLLRLPAGLGLPALRVLRWLLFAMSPARQRMGSA